MVADASRQLGTTDAGHRPRVLVAGGGVAALELLPALRVHAGAEPAITLLSADADFAPPARIDR